MLKAQSTTEDYIRVKRERDDGTREQERKERDGDRGSTEEREHTTGRARERNAI